MCDIMLASVAAGAISGVGSLYSGMNQAAAYRDQAAFADRQARLDTQAGAYEAARQGAANDRRLAGMQNAFVSSGIALSGSAAAVIEDSAAEASLDEQALKHGAAISAANQRFTAELARRNAGAAVIGGVLDGVASVANGFTSGLDRTRLIPNGFGATG